MIKLCTIDLDGTLFDDKKDISEANILAINEAKKAGCKIVIATGRPYNGVKPVLEKLNLLSEEDYVICYNGAKIMNVKTGEIIFSDVLNLDEIRVIEEISKKENVNIHAFLINEDLITPKHNQYTDVEASINKITDIEMSFDNFKEDDLFLKVMLVDDPTNLNRVEINLSEEIKNHYSVVRSSKIFLEFLNKNTDKGKALAFLANYLNIDINDTMAIGDAGNDLNMIKTAGIGVAMDNAFPYVKHEANFITKSNLQSGVAYAINKFILNK